MDFSNFATKYDLMINPNYKYLPKMMDSAGDYEIDACCIHVIGYHVYRTFCSAVQCMRCTEVIGSQWHVHVHAKV